MHSLRASGKYVDMRRLQELRDPGMDRSWLYRLDRCRGQVFREHDYVDAVGLRLGAAFGPEAMTRAECGVLMSANLSHSSCCARAERTKRHYAKVRICMDYIRRADAGATLEQRRLSQVEPRARPGDVFTMAGVPNRDAALDITIASEEAGGAGGDCVHSIHSQVAPISTGSCRVGWHSHSVPAHGVEPRASMACCC